MKKPAAASRSGPAGPGRAGWIVLTVAAVLVAAAAGFWRAGLAGPDASLRRSNLLLITVDTLRADRLGAYGWAGIRTPNIDRLAREGVLFETCLSPTPLTLPSHTSLMSGTYPLHHGVRDNGSFVVPKELATLAMLLGPRGFRTGAVVSSFVLDSRWGLNRGFQDYLDTFDTHVRDVVSIGDIQRPANEVVDVALQWLEKNGGDRFFLWVHFYDPHDPYTPPPPFREQYAEEPYLGEIAFVDSEIGRLLAWFDAREKRIAPTLTVFAGDHGESLGEHEERGHGFFLYDATLHVPLIVRLPGRAHAGSRHRETVSLVDVLPTLTDLFGVPEPPGVQGQSLVPLLRGARGFVERPVYAETFYPRLHFGWSELRALQDGRLKLIDSPEPEVYDGERDARERQDVASSRPELLRRLQRELAALSQRWSSGALPAALRQTDPETVAKLASLGYLTGAAPASSGGPLPAPRAKIGVYNRLLDARALIEERSFPEAERELREILKLDAGVVDAYSTLGSLYLRQKRFSEAAAILREAVARKPSDPLLAVSLALAEVQDHKPAEAEASLEGARLFFPNDSRFPLFLAKLATDRKDAARADRLLARVLELDPRSAPTLAAISEILLDRGDLDAALRRADEALALDPKVRGAHYCRGKVFAARGRLPEAWREHAEEIERNPEDSRGFRELLELSRRLALLREEEAALRSVIARRPDAPLAYLYLARNSMDRNERLDEAIALAEQGIARKPGGSDLALGYYVLADLYSRTGRSELSRESAQKGRIAERTGG